MKKSLLAIAIAAAVPAVASAQVTVGGLMDISVVNVDNGSKSKLVTSTGDRSSNNINFQGVEKISDNLSGIFHAEFGFDVDNGLFNGAAAGTSSTTGFGMTRRAIAGLRGSFGEIRGGRDYTPIFIATNTNSIHGTSGFASNLTYVNAAGGGTGVVGHDVRFSNGVWYHSPVMSGFSLRAAMSNGTGYEDFNQTKNGVGTSFALVYDQGPIFAQVSNSSQKDYAGTGTALVNTTGPGKKEVISYGGKYTMGAFQVAVGAQQAESTSNAGIKVKNETVYYGGAFTTGATRISLQGANVKVSGNTGSAGAGGGKDYTALTLLVNHSLSKRSSIYGTWGQINNEANQNVGIRSNGLTYAASGINKDQSAIGVGFVHSF